MIAVGGNIFPAEFSANKMANAILHGILSTEIA